jgi:hypothetical protein
VGRAPEVSEAWADGSSLSSCRELLGLPDVRLHGCDACERIRPSRSRDTGVSHLRAGRGHGSLREYLMSILVFFSLRERWVSGESAVVSAIATPLAIGWIIPILFLIGGKLFSLG